MLYWFTIIFFKCQIPGVTTESGGRQNMFPSETRPYIDESVSYDGYPQNAEKLMADGLWLVCCTNRIYVTTGQIIPGIFKKIILTSNVFIKFVFNLILRKNQMSYCI